jgi:lipooligosaccharide transport system ATP-binding protein
MAIVFMPVIKTENLTKKFKELIAVNNISLEIHEGECFGLLGPNGAGKTSLIRMITAVSPPTAGNVRVLDQDLRTHARQVKTVMGIVPQIDNLDVDLSVLQNLITFARYIDIPKAEARRRSMEVLKLFQLEDKLNSKLHELSGGMKRRLLIARSLINLPKIIVLDEPTIGLDPQAKYLVWHKLAELKSQGITLLLCTQNMEEASVLCDRVAIMNQGEILSLESPDSLVSRYVGEDVWDIWLSGEEKNSLVTELKRRGLDYEEVGDKIEIFNVVTDTELAGLTNNPRKLKRRTATLEDVFFKLTGRVLAE